MFNIQFVFHNKTFFLKYPILPRSPLYKYRNSIPDSSLMESGNNKVTCFATFKKTFYYYVLLYCSNALNIIKNSTIENRIEEGYLYSTKIKYSLCFLFVF